MAADAILIAATGWDQPEWAASIRAADPARRVHLWPAMPNPGDIAYALVWKPPAGLLASLPNLKAIFSLGAGVDHLIFQPDLPTVPVVRVVDDDLTERMTEWVVLQVLMHHRRQRTYDGQQRARLWRELTQPAAREVGVGFMGMGVLGRSAAMALARLGFDVAGWSRSGAPVAGVEMFAAERLNDFLARTDILVSLLPLTSDTRGLLAMPLFERLRRSRDGLPVVIDAGRGGLQVEADIVRGLQSGVLGGASLDVFETEPLDRSSPLWGMDNVIITPHASAFSSPAALAPVMLQQIRDFEAGRPLPNLVDRVRGYQLRRRSGLRGPQL